MEKITKYLKINPGPNLTEFAQHIVEATSKAELDVLRSSVFLSFKRECKVLVLLCNEVEYRLTHPEERTEEYRLKPTTEHTDQPADCSVLVSTGTRPEG